MLTPVSTVPKAIADYAAIVGDDVVEELRALAAPLQGARVLHVNATAFGGGVAEILGTLVPLLTDLGLATSWQVIRGADEFFAVTKAMHNSLQGMHIEWSPEMWDTWLRYNRLNASQFDEAYDFVVIHDPQPAPLRLLVTEQGGAASSGKWLWRCHIDLTDAEQTVWGTLHPYVEAYDGAIFTMKEFVQPDLRSPHIFIIPPSIDPLSLKNVPLTDDVVRQTVRSYGVDPDKPFLLQVSRFDPWKDPLGVIEVYRLVKQEIPDIHLVLIASMASDDPEGWSYFERIARRAGDDYNIHILSNINGVGNLEVNAFQRAASVVLQKSLREGFGLTVSEALWKGRPVVAGRAGGIPLQVVHGRTGLLVDSVAECAEWVLYLLEQPKVASAFGEAGREHVRQNFLTTRHLRDYLQMFHALCSAAPPERSPEALRR